MSAIISICDGVAPGKNAGKAVGQSTNCTVSTPQLWPLVTGFVLISGVLFLSVGYRVDDPSIGGRLALYFINAGVAFAALKLRLWPRLAWGVAGMLQSIAIGVGGMMLAYAAASVDLPLIDDKLLLFDRTIGYHWEVYAQLVHSHAFLSGLLFHSYMLIFELPIIITFILASTGSFRQINRYIIASMVSIVLTSGIFALFPALTAWDHLGIDPHLIQQFKVLPDATTGWERDLIEIRAGRGFMLHNANGSGLIAFPSYHCVAGLMFVWALWPVIWTRLPSVTAASLLIAATPIYGGHYIADLAGGAVVTVVSVAAAYWFERYWHRRYQEGVEVLGAEHQAHL